MMDGEHLAHGCGHIFTQFKYSSFHIAMQSIQMIVTTHHNQKMCQFNV